MRLLPIRLCAQPRALRRVRLNALHRHHDLCGRRICRRVDDDLSIPEPSFCGRDGIRIIGCGLQGGNAAWLIAANKIVTPCFVFLKTPEIYFATLQILGANAMLLKEILVNPLKDFLQTLSAAIDVPEMVGGLGLSCANPEFSGFKTVLIMATLAPVMLSLGIAVSFVIFVVVFKHDRSQISSSHGQAVLLLLYLTLPSTSITILKAFLCDSRSLGANGEGYLIADYAGAFSVRCDKHTTTPL